MGTSSIFCAACGKEAEEDANFCRNCGKPVSNAGKPQAENPDIPRLADRPSLGRSDGIGGDEGLDRAERELQRQIDEQQEKVRDVRRLMAQERRIRNSQREIRRLEEEELRELERLEYLRLSLTEEAWAKEYGDGGFLSLQPKKSKVVAGVFALLLGGLGVHKFYLGYTSQGLILLAASIVSLLLWIVIIGLFGTIAIGVICLIEGITYLTKTDEEFHETYVVNRKPWF